VRADIKAFFDEIRHENLVEIVRKRVRGGKFFRLLHRLLAVGASQSGRGLAQGSPLSPVLANLLLSSIDAFFDARQTLLYTRYMDDVLFVVPGSRDLAEANLWAFTRQLHRLGLRLNPKKTEIVMSNQGTEFLGVFIKKTSSGIVINPTERTIHRLRQKLDELEPLWPITSESMKKLQAVTTAWAAQYSGFGDPNSETASAIAEALLTARLQSQPMNNPPKAKHVTQ
jgi:hypothetical protein